MGVLIQGQQMSLPLKPFGDQRSMAARASCGVHVITARSDRQQFNHLPGHYRHMAGPFMFRKSGNRFVILIRMPVRPRRRC
jgi:hypothetical protein